MGNLEAAERQRERRGERATGRSPSVGAWRFLTGAGEAAITPDSADPVPGTSAGNMAMDAALLEAVRAGAAPVLRLYRWDPPTLSFGRNQPSAGRYDEVEAAERGIAFVRRPTGGQAVLHDDELTYAVVAPVSMVGKPRSAYRRINAALVAGLRRLGVEASLAGGVPLAGGGHDWASACFRTPAAGEVVARGRKLVGSAQRTEGRTILQHGSILVGGTQAAAEELLKEGASSGGAMEDPGWTTVSAELGRRPSWAELAGAVVAGFEEVLGITLAPRVLTVEEAERARRLESRFASGAWTWRR